MADLTPTTWLALQRRFYANPRKGLALLKESLLPDDLEAFFPAAKKDLAQIEKLGLRIVTWSDAAYPKILKEIYDPPLLLLAKGKWLDWEAKDWVAVVGARKATAFSLKKTAEVVRGLVEKEIGIVSGLAYGVDAQAHKAALDGGGTTWGVLGSGPDVLYPQRNAGLAQKMTVRGGTLSEFPLGTTPYAGHFPQRNRIVSGLSQAVIVIEASIKSGSLITARFGLEQGREVFVVVPPEERVAYEGNKKLLDEGATPLESVEQVVEGIAHFREGKRTEIRRTETRRTENREWITENGDILQCLLKPVSLDVLSVQLGKAPQEILATLLMLEVEGLVQKRPGGIWQSR